MKMLTRLISASQHNPADKVGVLQDALVDCGVVRSMISFLQSAFDVLSNVMRCGLSAAFAREYKNIRNAMESVWACLIGTHSYKVYEEILESGFIQQLVESHLNSKVLITLPVVDPDYDPMVLRQTSCLLLRELVLNRPHSERLVEEVVNWIHTTDTISREIREIQSSGNKRGAAQKKRTSAAVLSLIAMLNIESTERELAEGKAVGQGQTGHRQTDANSGYSNSGYSNSYDYDTKDEGIVPAPRSLLYLSSAFSALHPGVVDSWLRWASKAKDLRAAARLTSDEAAGTYDQALDNRPYNDDDDDGDFTGGVEVPLDNEDCTAGAKRLMAFSSRPLGATDAPVLDRKNALFDEDRMAMSLPGHRPSSSSNEGGAEEMAAQFRPKGMIYSDVSIPLVLDRMGHLVLAVKQLFDSHASASGLVETHDAQTILLELGLRGSSLAEATAGMNNMKGRGDHNSRTLLDFPTFLQHYALACQLASNPPKVEQEHEQEQEQEQHVSAPVLLWIPSASGIWKDVDLPTTMDLLKSSSPYSTSSEDAVEVGETDGNKSRNKNTSIFGRGIWVRSDDVQDILMLCGMNESEIEVGEAIRSIRNFLPGLSTGKLCFQEILAIYVAVRDVPQGPKGMSLGGGGGGGGGDTGGADRSVDVDRRDRVDIDKSDKGKFSRPSNPQHNRNDRNSSQDPFSGGIDESIYKQDSMGLPTPGQAAGGQAAGGARKSTRASQRRDAPMESNWSLPFRKTAIQTSKQTISTEFRKLDLRGEGRLTFLTLKSALELREVPR